MFLIWFGWSKHDIPPKMLFGMVSTFLGVDSYSGVIIHEFCPGCKLVGILVKPDIIFLSALSKFEFI